MSRYKCTAIDCPTNMFSVGKVYEVVDGKTGVRDDLGHLRYLGDEARFSIANTCNGSHGRVYYARFEVCHGK